VCKLTQSDVTGPMNIGSGKGESVAFVAKTVLNVLNKSQELLLYNESSDSKRNVVIADVSKLEYDLGFKSTISIEQGIRQMIKFRNNTF
jgi:nucleoside-diphosphate-sugar epimerase